MNENIVVKVGADISQLAKNLNSATADIKDFGAATSASMKGAVKDMRVYEDASGRLRKSNGQFVTNAEKAALGLGKVGDNAKTAGTKLNDFGNNAKSVGTSMAMSFGAAALAIGGALGFAVKKAADFDSQIRKAGAIAGATAKELDAMRDAALQMGATTSESASSVALAMTELSAKGFNASQVIAAMPGIISAAEASGEDLALTADTVSTALNVWGLEAKEAANVADVLAMSANVSAAGIDDLGYVLKYAGAPAAALGISLEELAAAAGLVIDSGLDGSNAGTALRASLLALNNPAKAQSKIMDSLGFSMRNSNGEAKGLAEMIRDMTKATEGMTEAEKVATLGKLVGTEAVSGFLALMKAGPDAINANTKALENSGGAAEAAATKMKAGIGGALENLSGAFESLTITIGDQLVPMVMTLAKFLSGLAEKFTNLSDGTKKFIVVGTAIAGIFTAIVAAIGIVLMVIGGAISGLGAIAGAMGIAGGAAGLLSAAFAFLTGPIGIAIAAIVGIVAALVIAYKKVDWFRDLVDKAWASIKSATMLAFEAVKSTIKKVMTEVMSFVGDILGKLKAFWAENGSAIKALVSTQFKAIWEIIKGVMGYIKGVFQAVWPIIAETVKVTWAVIKTVVSSALDIILGLVATMMNLLEGDWKGAWESVKKIVTDVWENIKKYLGSIDLAEIGRNIMEGLIRGIKSMSDSVKGVVKGIIDAIPAGVKKILGIASPSRVMKDIGKWTGRGLVDGMAGEVSAVERMAKTLAEASVANLSGTGGYSIAGYKTPSTSAGVRSSSLATGTASASGGTITNNYYATIDAKDVKDFTDVVKLFDKQTIARR